MQNIEYNLSRSYQSAVDFRKRIERTVINSQMNDWTFPKNKPKTNVEHVSLKIAHRWNLNTIL